MSLDKALSEFKKSLLEGDISKLDNMLSKNKTLLLKLLGASIWEIGLSSKHAEKNLSFLIKRKATVYLPKPNAKRVTYDSNYTLAIAIKHKSATLTQYLLKNYKIHQTLLDNAIIRLCGMEEFENQAEILRLLIDAGGDCTVKKNKAIFSATFNDNSTIIPTLVDNGSYLINQKCAILFFQQTKLDPFSYLTTLTNELSVPAVMEVISAEDVNDLPIQHYEDE
tara:strand:- start:364 stop:1032 length:669 start_codon:yes stop_codon:yes gene_type:complete